MAGGIRATDASMRPNLPVRLLGLSGHGAHDLQSLQQTEAADRLLTDGHLRWQHNIDAAMHADRLQVD